MSNRTTIRNALAKLLQPSSKRPAPRRVVLLGSDDHGPPVAVLSEPSAVNPLAEVWRLTAEGRVAGEHMTPLGWQRFIWSGKRS